MDHEILLRMIERKIKDTDVIWLIKVILKNHRVEVPGKGMPLGNLTSQFFANVYLDELDHFVKHALKVKYYIRYVDDFVILHKDRKILEKWREEIDRFLRCSLKVELHPEKTRIEPLSGGLTMLGFRVFYHHRLLKRSNARRIWMRLERHREKCDSGEINPYEARASMAGWLAYAHFANTYGLRKRVTLRFDHLFHQEPAKEYQL